MVHTVLNLSLKVGWFFVVGCKVYDMGKAVVTDRACVRRKAALARFGRLVSASGDHGLHSMIAETVALKRNAMLLQIVAMLVGLIRPNSLLIFDLLTVN